MSPPLAQSVDCAKAARCRRLGSEPVADIAKATILIRNGHRSETGLNVQTVCLD